jgi:eukaryotic-like serine/threonine-protein kinase
VGGVPPVAITEVGFQQEVVPDDGSLLWASPTTGKPVAFRMVPPGGSVFMIVRPSDLLASSEGAKVLAALGPAFAAERAKWEAAAGFKLEEIERLIFTLHNNDAKFPRASFVVQPKTPLAAGEFPARWGNPPEQKADQATYFAGPAYAYYVGAASDAGSFVMGDAVDVQAVAKVAGAPPNIMRDLERIRRTLDGDRHVNILVHPQFFFNDDGEPLFAGDRAKVRQPLSWLLGDSLQAAAVSLHCGDEFYFELRMLGSLDKEPYRLASEFRDRLNQAPTSLEDYFVALTPPPYWKKLAFRYPGIVRKLHEHLRVGVENDQAVMNSVLPGAAAHNLVLGGELLVATAPGAPMVAAAAPPKTLPKTIPEALQLKTTFSFDAQSLEFAMRDLAIDVNDQLQGGELQFGIKIIGPDLEKDGVTRNMSITNFKQENAPIGDILTALVMKTTTAKGPTDPGLKLIWVVADDPEAPGKQVVLLTTRAAAAAKGYKVPDVFLEKKS